MSHLPFTILAYFLNSVSVTTNKLLLNKAIPDPFLYIFYVSVFSLIILPAIIFIPTPTPQAFLAVSLSTILWTMGAYFMYRALKLGQMSRVIPVIGTLISLILLFAAVKTVTISQTQTLAVTILIFGMIAITVFDWTGKFKRLEAVFEVISAVFFAISYIFLRQAYTLGNFLTILVWGRVVLVPLVLYIFLAPILRKRIIGNQFNIRLIFFGGQLAGGASELLLTFSISLANPALVNSLQGVQYVFLLIFGKPLGEKYSKLQLLSKILGIILIGTGLYLLAAAG
ncbi:hypothetical protein A3C26_00395 [Candidatus Daviesbacteria bacterium RIFCSPHIGHO2_02_FULL_39_12]|uniref:EamA domain-containing protein n=2 Tax=Candidatus Daviesiibacteriota TaxID=1752718 RepID=A0A1F5J8J6_9BACT|nr:MAG: hypothetical protein A3C26_00395 [Candidatus Daviesbacteria bacterium RIFCSPHIGHO2_02_FULL_39_12]OGE72306.1 MAG: hypothetical protein A3H40_02325 [Candidatus Daviesbacteria bacterium RIFCSPLOWO2_02_FULL_38_15]